MEIVENRRFWPGRRIFRILRAVEIRWRKKGKSGSAVFFSPAQWKFAAGRGNFPWKKGGFAPAREGRRKWVLHPRKWTCEGKARENRWKGEENRWKDTPPSAPPGFSTAPWKMGRKRESPSARREKARETSKKEAAGSRRGFTVIYNIYVYIISGTPPGRGAAYFSLMFLMMSITIPLKEGSLVMRASTFWMA